MHNKRKRMIFLSQHRGTKEADIMVGRFVEETLPKITDDQLEDMEEFLQIADATLIDWAYKRKVPEGEELTEMVSRFVKFYA